MRTKKVDTSENEPIVLPDTTETKKSKTITYEVRAGDTLQSIAVKFSLDWKTLASNNNIKEPYVMKIGQKLKVPILLEI